MPAFITWYIILTILGWLAFPLVYHLFPALSDRGYTLARTVGLLVWGYAFWLFTSLGLSRNDLGGILLALAVLIALSLWSFINHRPEIVNFIKSNLPLTLTTEFLFLIAFGFLAFVRSANPELASTEKPMELMFINSILRSETFPPQDAWLTGYSISYYYFGYVLTAMLAMLANINASIAHNLMTSLIFGLGAIGSFGIVYNLLNRGRQIADDGYNDQKSSIVNALFAPLFLLLVSNLETVFEVLHRLGLFWSKDANGTYTSAFWTWFDMKELSQPPMEPFGYMPDRYLWWWRASRVIQDYDIVGGAREVIDEFPFFSFLLGDLHPHVLAIPFGLLAVSVAFNIFLGGARGKLNIFGARLDISPAHFAFTALVLGGLAFLNTWDILIAAALIVFSFVLWRAHEEGWSWTRIEDLVLFALPLGIVSLLAYFPFYLGFSSQAGGIIPNFMYITRGTHLWVMWGTLLIPIFSLLLYIGMKEPPRPNWKLGFTIGLSLTLTLLLLMFVFGILGLITDRPFIDATLASYNMSISQYLAVTFLRRLNNIGSLITLLAVLIPALALLFRNNQSQETSGEEKQNSSFLIPHSTFVFLLAVLGSLLVLAPEFVFLRDQFGYRINTVFKFYYQAWMLWSLVAAFGVGYLLQTLRGFSNIAFRVLAGIVIFCGLLYPVFGVLTKTNNFNSPAGFDLNDFNRLKRENPDDAAAIEFLLTQPEGVIAEAVGGGYSYYGRISTYTGYPTVLGWIGHEAQWRGGYHLHGTREEDIKTLYTTTRWEEAQAVIDLYNIRYIVIGNQERFTLPVNEEKFMLRLTPVFQQGSTVVYQVP